MFFLLEQMSIGGYTWRLVSEQHLLDRFHTTPNGDELWSGGRHVRFESSMSALPVHAFRANEATHYVFADHGDRQTVTKSKKSAGEKPTIDIEIKVSGGDLVNQRDAEYCDTCFGKHDYTLYRKNEVAKGGCRFAFGYRLCARCNRNHAEECYCRDANLDTFFGVHDLHD